MKCQKELRVKYGELHERERSVKLYGKNINSLTVAQNMFRYVMIRTMSSAQQNMCASAVQSTSSNALLSTTTSVAQSTARAARMAEWRRSAKSSPSAGVTMTCVSR